MKTGRPGRVYLLIPLIFLTAACASPYDKLKRVDPGMMPSEVNAIMGVPGSAKTVRRDGSMFTLYRYANLLCNPNLSAYDRCDFFVVFKNGKVLKTGVKQGNSYSPNMEILSLFENP